MMHIITAYRRQIHLQAWRVTALPLITAEVSLAKHGHFQHITTLFFFFLSIVTRLPRLIISGHDYTRLFHI